MKNRAMPSWLGICERAHAHLEAAEEEGLVKATLAQSDRVSSIDSVGLCRSTIGDCEHLGQVTRRGSREYISKARVSKRCDQHECSAPKMGENEGRLCVVPVSTPRGVAVVTPHCFEGVSRELKYR